MYKNKSMKEIKKIDVRSHVKMTTAIGGALGLACGIYYGIGGAIYDFFTTGLNYGSALALMAIVAMPAIGAGFGLIFGLIVSPTYNAVAKRFGGVKMDIKEK